MKHILAPYSATSASLTLSQFSTAVHTKTHKALLLYLYFEENQLIEIVFPAFNMCDTP